MLGQPFAVEDDVAMVLPAIWQHRGIFVGGKGRQDAGLVVLVGELDVACPVRDAVPIAALDTPLAPRTDRQGGRRQAFSRFLLVDARGSRGLAFLRLLLAVSHFPDEREHQNVGRLHRPAVQILDEGQVVIAAARSHSEALGVVGNRYEVEGPGKLHEFAARGAQLLALREAIGILDGQARAEELRVEPEPDLKGQPSLTIELEDDPIERMREQETFLVRSASRSRVDKNRTPSGYHAPRRHGGRVTFALIIAGIGYAIYSQFALPTQIIDEAEVKIIKALKRQPPTQPTEQAEEQPEAIEEIEEEPILPRSLLDRADELAAETGLDKIPLPSLDEMVADPTEELAQAEKVGNSDLRDGESGEITPSEFATPVSEDIVVLNEYTAIPEAASNAPKLSIPGTEKTKPDSPRSRAATTETTAKSVIPQQGGHPKPEARKADTKPPVPAKIDTKPSANSTKPFPAVQFPAAIDTNPKEPEEEAVVPTPESETTEADLLSTTPIWL